MSTNNRTVTGPARLAYEHVFKPHAATAEAEPKYSATFLIPKTDTDTVNRVMEAINAAMLDGVNRGVFKAPIDPMKTKYPPLRDGDAPNDSGESRGPEFAGHWFIPAKATLKNKPFVVDANVQEVIDPSEVYSGCYVNFAVSFYAYENSGNRGISAGLQGVQKVGDGERFGSALIEAKDVFSALGSGSTGGFQQAPTGGFQQQSQAGGFQQQQTGLGF